MLSLVQSTPESYPVALSQRDKALMAYQGAVRLHPPGDPAINWEALAALLNEALVGIPADQPSPAPQRRKRTQARATAAAKPVLADYSVDKATWKKLQWPSPRLTVTFEDGEIVRAPAVSIVGKPVNVGRGLRIAVAFYQSRLMHRLGLTGAPQGRQPSAPAIVNVIDDARQSYDVAAANEITAQARQSRSWPQVSDPRQARAHYWRQLRKAGLTALNAWNTVKRVVR